MKGQTIFPHEARLQAQRKATRAMEQRNSAALMAAITQDNKDRQAFHDAHIAARQAVYDWRARCVAELA